MSSQEPEAAIKATIQAFEAKLGAKFLAHYTYGSVGQPYFDSKNSNINQLSLFAEETSIHAIRDAFLPVWWSHRKTLKRAPFIAFADSLNNHFQICPVFGHQFYKQAQLKYGESLLPASPNPTLVENMADLLAELLIVSRALTPSLLLAEEQVDLLMRLRRLYRRFGYTPSAFLTAPEMFAQIQERLMPALTRLRHTNTYDHHDDAPSMLPNLQAIYEREDVLTFVLPELNAGTILKIDWQEVAALVKDQCIGLQLATAQQFQIVVEYYYPLQHKLSSFNKDWGSDLLSEIEPSSILVLQEAGRLPSQLEIDELLNDYLTTEEEHHHRLIHDFQNKILNIQLRHELLSRMKQATPFNPPQTLPSRDEPPAVRIEAIHRHLHWWAAYYAKRIQSLLP